MTSLLSATAAIFAASDREDRTKGLYQWLFGWASFFRPNTSDHSASRTVRTEVTVERRQGIAALTSNSAGNLETRPLCGTQLAPQQAEGRLRTPKSSISA
jgi:hypothetical protein